MNREWVLVHLNEAHDQLSQAIKEISDSPDYDFGEFFPAMQHVYLHLNTAWNARDASENELANQTTATYRRWSSMPADLVMFE